MQLSTNFTLEEFTRSQTAIRQNIDNTPTEEHSENLKLSEILASVKKSYTSTIGYEFMHIMDSRIRSWFLDKIEGKPTPYSFSDEEKEHA